MYEATLPALQSMIGRGFSSCNEGNLASTGQPRLEAANLPT